MAGGNLAELLGVTLQSAASDRGGTATGAVARSPFRDLLRGGPADCEVIDVHAHVGEWGWEHKPSTGAAGLLRASRPLGLVRAYINSTEAVVGGDHLRGNAEVADAARSDPDFLRGLVVFNPGFDGGAESLRKSLGQGGIPRNQDPPPDPPLRDHRPPLCTGLGCE